MSVKKNYSKSSERHLLVLVVVESSVPINHEIMIFFPKGTQLLI